MKRCVRPSECLPLAACVIALTAQPLVALAQDAPPPALGQPSAATPVGTVNCFDYYHFGSVQVDVTPSVASAVSGVPITFTGKIKNANPYPIVDGSVYVKIFRERGDGSKDSNGPDVVDQFYAMDGLTIPANGQLPASITWNIPAYAELGQYRIATFFTVSHKFNLLGLPFTDDVVGNTADFKVSGELKTTVGLERRSDGRRRAVSLRRVPAAGACKRPCHHRGDDYELHFAGRHRSSHLDAQQMERQRYEQRHRDAHGAGNDTCGRTKTRLVFGIGQPVSGLPAHRRFEMAGRSSIINVRFVRDGKDLTRINFPAVTSYPLTAGTPTTLFSCLHNAGSSDVVPNSSLVLTLLDQNGGIIHSYTYTGGVTGAMMGVADNFTPNRTYDTFKLEAQLYQGQNLVDQSEVSYDCHDLNPALCTTATGESDLQNVLISLIELVASLLIIGALIYFARRSSKWGKQPTSIKK